MATLPFDISSLNATLGAYFRENVMGIIQDELYDPMNSDEGITAWDIMEKITITDQGAWGTADFDLEVQDGSLAFSDQGSVVTVNGNILQLRHMRSDFSIDVTRLYNSWLSHIEQEAYHNRISSGDLAVSEVAFGRWLISGAIKKFFEKLYLQTSFLGEYAASFTAVAGQSFNDAADGFVKVLQDARTAVEIPAAQVVTLGAAVTNANAYAHFENLGKAIPTKLFYKDMFLLSSVGNVDDYNDGFKAGNPGANQRIHDAYKRTRLESRPRGIILPTPEMGTNDFIFMTPRNNLIFATDFRDQPPQLFSSVSSDPMKINVTLSYKCGFGVKRADWIVCNDR